jgi:hypothetical protein
MTKKHPNKNTSYISIGSGHPIDADFVIINGVEYKRVEEPKPQTLYDIILEWNDNEDYLTCEELVNRIGNWLPKEQSAAGSQNVDTELLVDGFNHCLQKIKEMLR